MTLAIIASTALDSYGSEPVVKAKVFDCEEDAQAWFQERKEGSGWIEKLHTIPLDDILSGQEFSSW